jgi:hypothetical protein
MNLRSSHVRAAGATVRRDSFTGAKMWAHFFIETPTIGFLGNSRLLTQHYDRYLPFGLTLIVGVGWIRFYEARPQP